MRKPIWLSVVMCCLWGGCQVAGPGAGWESRGQVGSALVSLPPLETYPTGSPLPTGSYTHLVVGRCGEDGRFMAEAVFAPRGTIVARWVGYSATASSNFLAEAYGVGVPITVYTARVVVEGAPPPSGSTTGDVLYDPCELPVAGDVSDDPPADPGPQGDGRLWDVFSWLAIDTAQAIGTVASPPPPQ